MINLTQRKQKYILVEEKRETVQLNWPDAEKGVHPNDQNRACSVLTNYMDNGKFFTNILGDEMLPIVRLVVM